MGEEEDEAVHSVELTPGREGVGGTIREIEGEEARLGHQGIVSPLGRGTTHSSVLAWKIPWAERPGWGESMGCRELDIT